jgi:hypothetical protein
MRPRTETTECTTLHVAQAGVKIERDETNKLRSFFIEGLG